MIFYSLISYHFLLLLKASIICRTAFFCSGVSGLQPSNRRFKSGESSTISPSAKNWESVIPKPVQIVSNVAIDGTEFLRKIEELTCLLVKERGRTGGILVVPENRRYVKYAAYIDK